MTRKHFLGSLLAVAGGALVAAGTLLPWFYDEQHGRIEMRLIRERAQTVHLPTCGVSEETQLRFAEGDTITTEYSYKYSPEDFCRLAERAGWQVERIWTDERQWFGVWLLTASGAAAATR